MLHATATRRNSRISRSSRIAVIGAGNVGATAAYALMLRGLFSEIVLIDHNPERAVAEATDIADANAMMQPVRVWGGGYCDVKDASILVVTAGATTKDGEPRTAVAAKSAAIVRECVQQAKDAGFNGIIVVSSNPADAMTQVAQMTSGLPPERVIGTGTLLDSNRFRTRIADQLEVAPAAVEALVLGEHGDSEVMAYSTVRLGGVELDMFVSGGPFDRDQVANEVVKPVTQSVTAKGTRRSGSPAQSCGSAKRSIATSVLFYLCPLCCPVSTVSMVSTSACHALSARLVSYVS